MGGKRGLFSAIFLVLILLFSSFTYAELVAFQGKAIYQGTLIPTGNITVSIYDDATAGNQIYTETFDSVIIGGFFDVMLGNSTNLDMVFARQYWMDLSINGNDIDWSGSERKIFESGIGIVDSASINSTEVQKRVTGVCGAGYYATSINEDGSINCALDTGTAADVGTASGWVRNGNNVTLYNSTDNVGIGTDTPEFRLSLENDGGIIAKGSEGSGATFTTTGDRTMMLWYPKKSAFRAGYGFMGRWDDANIGIGSVAFGTATMASGAYSSAFGWSSIASGDTAFSAGQGVVASADQSTVFGRAMTVSGTNSFGIGLNDQSSTLSQANTMAIMGGDVGIGTTSPGEALDVVGNINASGNICDGAGNCLDTVGTDGTGGWTDDTGNTTTMRDVGIGTTSLQAKVNIKSSGTQLLIISDDELYQLYAGSDINHPWIGTKTDHDLRLITNGSEKMRITNEGNVGIGTNNPYVPLDVTHSTGGIGVDILHVSTGDTYFYTGVVANTDVRIGAYDVSSGSVSLIIQPAGGNVGIGTDSPGEALDVVGNINASGNICDGAGNCLNSVTDTNAGTICAAGEFLNGDGTCDVGFLDSDGVDNNTQLNEAEVDSFVSNNGYFTTSNDGAGSGLDADTLDGINSSNLVQGSGTAGYVGMWTGSSSLGNSIIYDDGTKVGIGTTSPDATNTLHVKGSIVAENDANISELIRNKGFHVWTDDAFGMELHYGYVAGGHSAGWATSFYGRTADTTAIRFGTYPGSSTQQQDFNELMTLKTNGYVGIGNVDPIRILHLKGSNDTMLRVEGEDGKANGIEFTDGSDLVQIYSVDQSLKFFIGTTVGVNQVMHIESDGNVGIGTTNPSAKLEVNGGVQSGITGENGNYLFGGWNVSLRSATSLNVLGIYTNNSERMRISADGNVGIGTTTPGSKLTVAGNITPSANDTYSLGTPDNVWKDVYVGNNSIHIGGIALSNNGGTLEFGGSALATTADTLPSGMISMFNSTCPSGWTYLSSMDGKFPRGAATYGATGGSDDEVVVAHIHSVDPPSTASSSDGDHTHSYTQFHTSGPNSAAGTVGLFGYYASTTGSSGIHTHTTDIAAFDSASTGSSGTGANVPAYVEVVFCLKD